MIKAKFGDAVRSKTDTAMVNEVLCKIICYNICCVIQEMHELGIDATFWSNVRQPETLSRTGRVLANGRPCPIVQTGLPLSYLRIWLPIAATIVMRLPCRATGACAGCRP